MRTLAAAVLAFESLVFALAIPVAIAVYGVDAAKAGWIGGAVAIGCLVVAGLLRFRWAYALGWGIQGLAILAGFVVPLMFVLGAVFGLLWWGALRLGAEGDAAQAAFRAQAAQAAGEGNAPDAEPGEEEPEPGPAPN
jgi:hypothetical protein